MGRSDHGTAFLHTQLAYVKEHAGMHCQDNLLDLSLRAEIEL